jgi:chorismate synthase
VQGGISNGEELYFRIAFKPTATVLQMQKTVNEKAKTPNLWDEEGMIPAFYPGLCPLWKR